MIGLSHYLTVAAILFTIGVLGIFLTRRNVILMLMAIELLLLAGRVDEVSAALTAADPLGWHHADHPGPVVLPVLWAAALGAAPAPDAGHLGALGATCTIARFVAWARQEAPSDWPAAAMIPSKPMSVISWLDAVSFRSSIIG